MKKYKIHFAPVQGLTDWTFRNIHAKFFGGVDAYYTPFIRVEKEDSFRSRDMKDCDPELNSVELLVPQVLGACGVGCLLADVGRTGIQAGGY